jgi:hypothetical protein
VSTAARSSTTYPSPRPVGLRNGSNAHEDGEDEHGASRRAPPTKRQKVVGEHSNYRNHAINIGIGELGLKLSNEVPCR